MKKILLATITAISLNAEMTPNCNSLKEKVLTQLNAYNMFMQTKDYKIAHQVITKLTVNMAWVDKECNQNNAEDNQVREIVYTYFDDMIKRKEVLDTVYGKIDYKYEGNRK